MGGLSLSMLLYAALLEGCAQSTICPGEPGQSPISSESRRHGYCFYNQVASGWHCNH